MMDLISGFLYNLSVSNNQTYLGIAKLVIAYIFSLALGTLILHILVKKRGKDNLSDWDCYKGYYYTFMYGFLGTSAIFGLLVCSIPMFIALLFNKSLKIFWVYLIPIVSFIYIRSEDLLFHIDDSRGVWYIDLRFLADMLKIVAYEIH